MEAQDHPEDGGFASPVGADQAGDLAALQGKADLVQDLAAAQPDRNPLEPKDLSVAPGCDRHLDSSDTVDFRC